MNLESIDVKEDPRAREYARLRRGWMALELVLSFLYCILFLVLGGSAWLRSFLEQYLTSTWQLRILFATCFLGGMLVFTAYTTYQVSHVLPTRYGLSIQPLMGWLWDQVKMILLGFLFAAGAVLLVYFLLDRFPHDWWWLAGGVYALFAVFLTTLAPVLIMPLFAKFTPLDPGNALRQRIQKLADRVGTRIEGVYHWDHGQRATTANAALTGIGPTRRIILSDTLLERYDPEEIEVILAHELGHHVHHDIWRLVVVNVVLILGSMYLGHLFLQWGSSRFGLHGPPDIATLPLLLLILAGVALLTTPLINTYSRRRELAADRFALNTIPRPDDFISAMRKLGEQNLAEVQPHPLVEFLFYTHPAIHRRIALGQQVIKRTED